MRRDGFSGRRPEKNAKSNCGIPWTIKGGINKHHLINQLQRSANQ